jgi:hypothetical protein
MITQRFRPVFWVAGVAVATTGLYLVSLRVATERGRLEAIDRQIAQTQREIRQLQTELGTRASLRQLEKWNGEALALTSPLPNQFLRNAAGLAQVDPTSLKASGEALPPIMVAAAVKEAPAETAAEAPVAGATAPAPIVNRSDKVALLDRALLASVPVAQIAPKPKIEAAKPKAEAQKQQ